MIERRVRFTETARDHINLEHTRNTFDENEVVVRALWGTTANVARRFEN